MRHVFVVSFFVFLIVFVRPSRGWRRISSPTMQAKGLTNLGHTCYLNSVIQTLYMSKSFREGVLNSRFKKKSPGDALQGIFMLLESGEHVIVNPSPLADALGIDRWLQQDAQEFMLRLLGEVDNSIDSAAFLVVYVLPNRSSWIFNSMWTQMEIAL
mmetsp:Transcript_1632/g.2593  ORF Transcript_1632/g.2593 Transcript_1632/m.2593 type:complete len:156 (+) Transcript_1632:43-510(+)